MTISSQRHRLSYLRSSLSALLLWTAACQNYQFNPSKRCLLQPGSSAVSLSDLSTADILFVVDDSGSMQSKQLNVAQNFGAFVQELTLTNIDRIQHNVDPIDFHIAITTSSIFENPTNFNTCKDAGNGQLRCCPAIGSCTSQPCLAIGDKCGTLSTNYFFNGVTKSGCTPGVGVSGQPYPQGDFVAKAGNPRVLHFEKALFQPQPNGDAYNISAINILTQQFGENIQVGTCGSVQEQHLEAARIALQKAFSAAQTVSVTEWPHPNSKLVVIWVGDEDDCSNPNNQLTALVLDSDPTYKDTCIADQFAPVSKLTPLQSYADYFKSLGRPFAAGFIVSTQDGSCTDPAGNTCQAGICSCQLPAPQPQFCSGDTPGYRFIKEGQLLRAQSDDTVVGTVCDVSFSTTLKQIAQIVKPPGFITLSNRPATGEITQLRVTSASKSVLQTCKGPALTQADRVNSDWYFVDCSDKSAVPAISSVPTTCIYVDTELGHCQARTGEGYSVYFLGQIAACSQAADCVTALGGQVADWNCFQGSCLCN